MVECRLTSGMLREMRLQVDTQELILLTGFCYALTGALAPEELFLQSIDILSAKCDKLLEQL